MASKQIVLVNPNLITVPAVAPYALDVLGTHLTRQGWDVRILDLTPHALNWQTAIDDFFAGEKTPDWLGISIRNVWDLYFPSLFDLPEHGSFIPSHKRIIDHLARFVPRKNMVLGGVGLSGHAEILKRRLGVDNIVKGPGELGLHQVLGGSSAPPLVIDRTNFVDNKWYYENGEHVGLRTANGCPRMCTFCIEPLAKGPLVQYDAAHIVAEIEQLVDQGIYDIHFADSEINFPSLQHTKIVLKAIAKRGFGSLNLWAYGQPHPFDRELASLMAEAGVKGILFGTDHSDPKQLARLGKWFRQDEIRSATKLVQDQGIAVGHELIFGGPGETFDSIRRSIDFFESLSPHVISVAIGIGLLPNTGLSRLRWIKEAVVAEDPQKHGVYFAGHPFEDPTFFLSPELRVPELYQQLQNYLGDRCHHIMVPSANSTETGNNQLVDNQLFATLKRNKRKGAHWYWYPILMKELHRKDRRTRKPARPAEYQAEVF